MPGQLAPAVVEVTDPPLIGWDIVQVRIQIRENALQQCHVADHADAQPPARGEGLDFDRPGEEAVRQLVHHNFGAGRQGLSQPAWPEVAHAKVPDLALCFQAYQRLKRLCYAGRILDRGPIFGEMPNRMWMNGPVDHVQVEVVQPEPAERRITIRGQRVRVTM